MSLQQNRRTALFGLVVGGATGFAIGRSTLTTLENLAFRVFLELDADIFDARDVLSSRIFWKLAVGTALGAVLGYLVGTRMGVAVPPPGHARPVARIPPPAPTSYH